MSAALGINSKISWDAVLNTNPMVIAFSPGKFINTYFTSTANSPRTAMTAVSSSLVMTAEESQFVVVPPAWEARAPRRLSWQHGQVLQSWNMIPLTQNAAWKQWLSREGHQGSIKQFEPTVYSEGALSDEDKSLQWLRSHQLKNVDWFVSIYSFFVQTKVYMFTGKEREKKREIFRRE